ncbi:MAG: hypothetical protein JKY01_01800 [Pseudomonadales bacterium]|nr:hypothetical protein [Pseudomonadales bacterium]
MKKLFIAFAFALASLLSVYCFSASSPEVSPYGKLLTDSYGVVKVEMANLKTKNEYGLYDCLVKVTGLPAFQQGIDGKVRLYRAVPAGRGFNLQYEKDGKWLNFMSSRQIWGNWTSMEIFLDGHSYDVFLDSSRSKDVRSLHLASAYSSPSDVDEWKYEINPYGISLTDSTSGLEVEIAYFNEKNADGLYDVLMRISGEAAFNAGVDGKVIRYTVKNSGLGYAFSFKKGDSERNRMTTRNNNWLFGKSYDLYFGNKTFNLYPNNNSSAVRPLNLLSEYKKQ